MPPPKTHPPSVRRAYITNWSRLGAGLPDCSTSPFAQHAEADRILRRTVPHPETPDEEFRGHGVRPRLANFGLQKFAADCASLHIFHLGSQRVLTGFTLLGRIVFVARMEEARLRMLYRAE